LDTAAAGLSQSQARVWAALADGPVPMSQLAGGYAVTKAVERLAHRGLGVLSGRTPSDAPHILRPHQDRSPDPARPGAAIWMREDEAAARHVDDSVEALARRIVEAVVLQAGRAVVDAGLAAEDGSDLAAGGPLGRRLVDRAVGPAVGAGPLLTVS